MASALHQPNQDDLNDWEGAEHNGGARSMYIMKGSSDMICQSPSWKGTETVFRPYPAVINPSDPKSAFEPYRYLLEDGRIRPSNWIRRYHCAWKVGSEATTFLIGRQPGSAVFDPDKSPLGVLYRAINSAVNNGTARDPAWAPLLKGAAGRGANLVAPKRCYLLQGMLLRTNTIEYVDGRIPLGYGEQRPFCLVLSGKTGDDLMKLLDKPKEGYAEGRVDPRDWNARYEHGDVVDLVNGKFIHIFEKGHNPYVRSAYQSQPEQDIGSTFGNGTDGQAEGGRGGFADTGYDIHISNAWTSQRGRRISSKMSAEPAQAAIRSHWRAWNNCLWFPSEIEQAHLLNTVFPPSAIVFAFESHKDWITEDTRKKLVSKTVSGYDSPVPLSGQRKLVGLNNNVTGAGFGEEPDSSDDPFLNGPSMPDLPSHTDAVTPSGVPEAPTDKAVDQAFGFGEEDPDLAPAAATPAATTAVAAAEKTEKAVARLNSLRKNI